MSCLPAGVPIRVDVEDEPEPLSLAALDARVAEIGRETTRRLQLVPFEGRAGDWDAMAQKHRDMLPILETARRRVGELRPPSARAAAYARYLEQCDRQLVFERSLLAAAEAGSWTGYKLELSLLGRSLTDVRAAARNAGLRSEGPTFTQRVLIRITLPAHLVKAQRHMRAERRAGRSWDLTS